MKNLYCIWFLCVVLVFSCTPKKTRSVFVETKKAGIFENDSIKFSYMKKITKYHGFNFERFDIYSKIYQNSIAGYWGIISDTLFFLQNQNCEKLFPFVYLRMNEGDSFYFNDRGCDKLRGLDNQLIVKCTRKTLNNRDTVYTICHKAQSNGIEDVYMDANDSLFFFTKPSIVEFKISMQFGITSFRILSQSQNKTVRLPYMERDFY